MLKGQIKESGLVDNEEMLNMAEEKVKLLQEQLDEQTEKLKELEEKDDQNDKEKGEAETERENELRAKEQENMALVAQLKKVEQELEEAKASMMLQREILDEVQKLKNGPLKGVDFEDNEQLKEERDRLLEENARMRSGLDESSTNPKDGDPNVIRYLRSKIYHFERTVERLEKERSGLTVRATMAEEQLKVL